MKEMAEVPKFFTMHPRETILSKTEAAVSATVKPTKQSLVHLTNWLMEVDQDFNPEDYVELVAQ